MQVRSPGFSVNFNPPACDRLRQDALALLPQPSYELRRRQHLDIAHRTLRGSSAGPARLAHSRNLALNLSRIHVDGARALRGVAGAVKRQPDPRSATGCYLTD